jgi:curved DNA-binding protein CbpA
MKIGAWEASIDFYALLGVPRSATPQGIRAAYRRLIFDSHPDGRRPSERPMAEARSKRINLAAAVLLDPHARARYDTLRAARSTHPTQAARRKARTGYQWEPRETDFWPFTYPTPAPTPEPTESVPAHARRRPRIDGASATVLLGASFVLGFAMLAWLAAPIEPPAMDRTCANEAVAP